MGNSSVSNRDLDILKRIEQEPDATQASIADQLGVAVGTINWHLKRLIAKGYVKVQRAERRKLRYIITPEGIALRARLTLDYIQTSFQLYRLVRQRMAKALEEIIGAGYHQIILSSADGDVADVCRLTCLEQGVDILEQGDVPVLKIEGLKIHILWNRKENTASESEA